MEFGSICNNADDCDSTQGLFCDYKKYYRSWHCNCDYGARFNSSLKQCGNFFFILLLKKILSLAIKILTN